ncbi:MAG: hypothetical protein KAI22_10675, partial [Gammaproteobacteria bacterium]|nr:hypothetical protein [Gammaproteobacteria bacterium]
STSEPSASYKESSTDYKESSTSNKESSTSNQESSIPYKESETSGSVFRMRIPTQIKSLSHNNRKSNTRVTCMENF